MDFSLQFVKAGHRWTMLVTPHGYGLSADWLQEHGHGVTVRALRPLNLHRRFNQLAHRDHPRRKHLMTDEEFDKILKDFDAKQQRSAEERARNQSEDAALIEKFTEYAHKQIEPALVTVGHKLQQSGHDYDVHPSKQNITFNFFPKNVSRADFRHDSTPHLTFTWEAAKRKVLVRGSNITPQSGGEAGLQGYYDLAEVTHEFVRERAMKLVQEVLAKQSR